MLRRKLILKLPVRQQARRTVGARVLLLVLVIVALFVGAPGQTPVARASTTTYVPLAGSTSIWGGFHTNCAIDAQGKALCWGGDGFDKTASTGYLPQAPLLAATFSSNHRCILTSAGGVQCRGNNNLGQLGKGDFQSLTNAWVTPSGLGSGVKAIASGMDFTCALMANNTVRCWGKNEQGQLGTGVTGAAVPTPTEVANLGGTIVAIAAGYNHACAISALGGLVACWGANDYGQIGNGTSGSPRPNVTVVKNLQQVTKLTAGTGHTCAVTSAGAVRCWGRNDKGQLGDDSQADRNVNVQVIGLSTGYVEVEAGDYHTCAVNSNGAMKCWGDNGSGVLGNGLSGFGQFSEVPVNVIGLPGPVTKMAATFNSTCAQLGTGGVMCWGSNTHGNVGDGTNTPRQVPNNVLVKLTCYEIMTSYSGQGALPTLTPAFSAPCLPNHFLPGTNVTLAAHPAAGWRLKGWVWSAAPVGGQPDSFAMPALDLSVGAQYEQCFALALAHSGQGANPVASPGSSVGCPQGTYAAGEAISLSAAPMQGQTITGWSGTANNTSTAATNSLAMPAAAASASVAYTSVPVDPGQPATTFVYLPATMRP